MTSLVPLDSVKHANLRLLPNSGVIFANKHHVLPLRVEEIGKAVSAFPVFLTRNTASGAWSFSLITSLEVERNLFIEDNQWMATYVPQIMETQPFYLIPTEDGNQFAVGIDEDSALLNADEGEPLFDGNGKMSAWLDAVTKRMNAQMQGNQQTFHFAKAIEEAGLVKDLSVQVIFADGTSQTINGLATIDEDKLQSLEADVLADFNKRGYLIPLHAMLLSIFQMNTLIQKHNRLAENDESQKSIGQVKIEVARDTNAGQFT